MSDDFLQIEAINGPLRGGAWPVSKTPLVFGRSPGCHVRINDPLASRRHCEIWIEGNSVRLNDLGSSNAVLVNGAPMREGILQPGDEFAVGKSLFRLASAVHQETPPPEREPETATLSPGEAAYLQAKDGAGALVATPRTVLELHALFTMSRVLSMQSTLPGLWDSVLEHLQDRFHPQACWMARYIPQEDSLLPHPGLPGIEKMPREPMLRSIHLKQAALLPRHVRGKHGRAIETTLIAPVPAGDDIVAVIALSRATPAGIYEEDDLKYLLTLCTTIGPFILAVERREQLQRDQEYRQARDAGLDSRLLGESAPLRELRLMAEKAAASRLSVVIEGESGTGKELVARMIHERSSRERQPYVAINCAAIPANLFESEMFGHEKGAFTGAHVRRVGRFEEAHGGTLFLDEIADCSRESQARMLRVLEAGTLRRLGGHAEIHVDTRIVAATNKPLYDEVVRGNFREDLYYRLTGITLKMPPLRTIKEDIPLLAAHFLELARAHAPNPVAGIAPETLELLQAWHWPGNVRELRACIERAVLVAQEPLLQPLDIALPAPRGSQSPPATLEDTGREEGQPLKSLQEVERAHILQVFNACEGKVRTAAEILGISHVTLYTRLHHYGIDPALPKTPSGE